MWSNKCLIIKFIHNQLVQYNTQMNQKTISIYAFVFAFIIVASNCQYKTLPDRTESVTNLCVKFQSRDQIVTEQTKAQNADYLKAMEAQFGDGNAIIKGAIGGDLSTLTSPDFTSKISIYVGAFFLALIILLFMFLFLCCCCTCPGCCPSKCCRKPEGEAYTKCELLWPAITLLATFLIILIAGALGVAEAGDIQTSVQATGCSLAITFDDFINGNVSTSGSYFIGIKTLGIQLAKLDAFLPTINTQFATIKTPGPSTYGDPVVNTFATLMDDISSIPDGTSNGTWTTLSYDSPLNTGANIGTLPSLIPTEIGDFSTSGKAIYDSQQALQGVQDGIISITDNVGSFQSGISGFSGTLSDLVTRVNDLSKTLEDLDSSFSSTYSSINPVLEAVKSVLTAFFAILIAFSIIGALGTILIAFLKFYKCRYLIYFICFILFIISIACLLVASVMSIFTPLVYFTCDFLQTSISSSDSFNSNFDGLLSPDQSKYLTICLPGSSGNLYAEIGGTATGDLDSLNQAINDMQNFDSAAMQQSINTAWGLAYNPFESYYSGSVLDFNDNADNNIAVLNKIAQADTSTGSYSGCSLSESWVPTSTRSPRVIQCKSSATTILTATQCGDTLINTVSCASGCVSAQNSLDSYYAAGNAANAATDITNKYSTCANFKNDLLGLQSNYYQAKYNSFGAAIARARVIQDTAAGPKKAYIDAVNALGTQFQSVLNTLSASISSITDPQYGLMAGFNCLIFGEDLQLLVDTLCSYIFNTVYFLRVATGMAGITIMFTMCCTVCTGVRHYKQGLIPENELPENNKQKIEVHPVNQLNKTQQGLYQNNAYYNNGGYNNGGGYNTGGMYQMNKIA